MTYFVAHCAMFPQKKSYLVGYYQFLNLKLLGFHGNYNLVLRRRGGRQRHRDGVGDRIAGAADDITIENRVI
ncbi:hypothetical protein ACSYB3_16725 [Klebsiella pneumoniae]|uniref:hypothetical protein n=1 Tax=Klebsiella pneumoniae TaxID=573 RepID=UPI003F65AF04